MFVVREAYDYPWTVRLSVPTPTGSVAQQFVARFRVGADSFENEQMARPLEEWLSDVVTGWDDVVDEDGASIEFSSARLRELLKLPFFRAALVGAVRESWSERRGNASAPSGDAG